jgi:nucleoside-diphosphate-sugar epimerase
MESEFIGPVNIGSEEMVTINQLVQYAADVAGKDIIPIHIPGPLGVRGRNSDNALVRDKLGWDYSLPLINGISKTYQWIDNQIKISE